MNKFYMKKTLRFLTLLMLSMALLISSMTVSASSTGITNTKPKITETKMIKHRVTTEIYIVFKGDKRLDGYQIYVQNTNKKGKTQHKRLLKTFKNGKGDIGISYGYSLYKTVKKDSATCTISIRGYRDLKSGKCQYTKFAARTFKFN